MAGSSKVFAGRRDAGFGGHGHIFNEVWDGDSASWRMIAMRTSGRYRRSSSDSGFSTERPSTGAPWRPPPGRHTTEKAVEYYSRGAAEWYLYWGNNIFEYDRDRLIRPAGTVSRSIEQLSSIVAGIHPQIHVLETPANEAQRHELHMLRIDLLVVAILVPLLLLIAVTGAFRLRMLRTRDRVRRLGPSAG